MFLRPLSGAARGGAPARGGVVRLRRATSVRHTTVAVDGGAAAGRRGAAQLRAGCAQLASCELGWRRRRMCAAAAAGDAPGARRGDGSGAEVSRDGGVGAGAGAGSGMDGRAAACARIEATVAGARAAGRPLSNGEVDRLLVALRVALSLRGAGAPTPDALAGAVVGLLAARLPSAAVSAARAWPGVTMPVHGQKLLLCAALVTDDVDAAVVALQRVRARSLRNVCVCVGGGGGGGFGRASVGRIVTSVPPPAVGGGGRGAGRVVRAAARVMPACGGRRTRRDRLRVPQGARCAPRWSALPVCVCLFVCCCCCCLFVCLSVCLLLLLLLFVFFCCCLCVCFLVCCDLL